MKPMTEAEAEKAMREAFPWAKRLYAIERWGPVCAAVHAWGGAISIDAHAHTLRAAVNKAIRAWRKAVEATP